MRVKCSLPNSVPDERCVGRFFQSDKLRGYARGAAAHKRRDVAAKERRTVENAAKTWSSNDWQ